MNIYLKKQDSQDYSVIQKNANISASKLVSLLWSKPEPNHKNLFYRDKAKVKMTQDIAKEKLKKKTSSLTKDEDIKITFEVIKHAKLERHLGITLEGKRSNGELKWHSAYIDEQEFLKYRNSMDWTDFFARIQRANFRAQSQIHLDNPKADDSKDDEYNPRASQIKRQLSLGIKKETEDESAKKTISAFQYGLNLVLKHPLVHGFAVAGVVGGALALTGFSALIASSIAIGLGLLTYGVEYLVRWRQDSFEKAYQDIAQMKPSEVQDLSDSYKSAFMTGLEADHWEGWTKSVVDTNAWKEYRAYGAGLKASEHHNDDLKQAIIKP